MTPIAIKSSIASTTTAYINERAFFDVFAQFELERLCPWPLDEVVAGGAPPTWVEESGAPADIGCGEEDDGSEGGCVVETEGGREADSASGAAVCDAAAAADAAPVLRDAARRRRSMSASRASLSRGRTPFTHIAPVQSSSGSVLGARACGS